MILPLWRVDAFTGPAAGGNPAAVIVLDDWLGEARLQAIAAGLALPATAFVVRRKGEGEGEGEGDAAVRWFAPTGEIRLCGHGTLATAHVMAGDGGPDRLRFTTRHAGQIEVARLPGGGFEMALPRIPLVRRAWPEAAALLGGSPVETWRSPARYAVFVYAGEAEVRALQPDFAALARLGDHQITCTARGAAADVVSRVFVPGAGNREDSATGSAHAALTPLWCARLGRASFNAHQASARGGDLTCRLDGDRAWIGGRCVTVEAGSYCAG